MSGITSKLLKIKANKTSVSFSVDGLDKLASLRKRDRTKSPTLPSIAV
ncbi:hypothetical protein THF5H11_10762 [Vibrio jasicida]|nr:hypothetical protein THF5H11_10762 [Vibrio jasicida]